MSISGQFCIKIMKFTPDLSNSETQAIALGKRGSGGTKHEVGETA
jgi:hypothetical protein